jgi:hypothetical protein
VKQSGTRKWAYPITDWEIIFKFKQSDKEYYNTFYNVSTLSNYFKSVPEQGMLVGYGKELPQHRLRQNFLPVSDGRLSMWYVENGQKHSLDFSNVFEFAKFLDNNPNVAKALSYVKKV